MQKLTIAAGILSITTSAVLAQDITIINRPDGTNTTVTTDQGTTSWVNSNGGGGGQSGREHDEIVTDIVKSIEAGGGSCRPRLAHTISCAKN
ncbi:MAG: hypothetical protein EOR60_01830 [Mesorhizobium sp.]|nr:MAG: hypothetical protein EOR60_01830 [Mesorhizobium sp.]